MHIYNGQPVNLLERITVGDVNYAAGWFLDPARFASSGILEVAEPVPPALPANQRADFEGFQMAEGTWQPKWLVRDATEDEVGLLQAQIKAAVAKAYADVDSVYADAVGQRVTEYQIAEADARAFVAAGYQGEPSAYVSCYAQFNETGAPQTSQWAADGIIARAEAFRAAELNMRVKRMEAQSGMRAAATPAVLTEAQAAWDGYITALRAQLGL